MLIPEQGSALWIASARQLRGGCGRHWRSRSRSRTMGFGIGIGIEVTIGSANGAGMDGGMCSSNGRCWNHCFLR
jgi:hypothetical protein